MKKKQVLSLLLALTVLLGAINIGIFMPAAAETTVYYPPNYDFTGLTKLSGNDGNQHATWTADGNGNGKIDATTKRTPSGSSVYFDDTTTNESAHIDMLGDNMLPAGDYTLYAWVKTENVVKQNAAAGDQGARIGVVQWKADKSGPNWPDIYGLSIAGTNDWTLLSYDFTVSADLDAMRLYVKFNNASGKVWFTDVTVQPKGTAYIDPKADAVELKDVYYPTNYDFAGMDRLSGNDNNLHGTWTADGNGNGKIDATTKRTPSGSSVYLDDTTTNESTHIDMIGANQLPAGDYTLYAWVKTENVVKQNAAAGDQGVRLGVVQWAADNASKDWSTEKYCLSVAGTNDWMLMSFNFTVAADKGAMRLMLRFNNASGKVWFTDVTVQPKGTTYIDPKTDELAPVFNKGGQVRGAQDGKIALRFGFDLACSGIGYEDITHKGGNYKRALSADSKVLVGNVEYTVVDFGAILSLDAASALTQNVVDGSAVVMVPAVNLYEVTEDTVTYTAVITNVPDTEVGKGTSIYARSYVAYEDNGEVKYTYGEIISRSVNDCVADGYTK